MARLAAGKKSRQRTTATHRNRLYQAAIERWKDACVLLDAERHLAAIYLGGYVIECYLKFMICERAGLLYLEDWEEREQQRIKGKKGHRLEALLKFARMDRILMGDNILRREFAVVNRWDVNLRYNPSSGGQEATRFLEAVEHLRSWLQEQL